MIKLTFSLAVKVIWFFIRPVFGFFWRSFINGLYKYGFALSLFLAFIFWALRREPKAQNFKLKEKIKIAPET